MSSDANGNFSLVPSYFVQNGDTVLPVQHNPPLEDIANGLTNRIMRDGRTVMTGNLQMGGNKVTGMADGTNPGDAVNKSQLDAVEQSLDDGKLDKDASNVGDETAQAVFRAEIGALSGNEALRHDQAQSLSPEHQAQALANAGELFRRKTADQTIPSSYTDVTDLTIPVLSGETWFFDITVLGNQNDNSGSLIVSLNGPAASAISFRRYSNRTNNSFVLSSNPITSFDDEPGVPVIAPQNMDAEGRLVGIVTFTEDGTFAVRARRDGSGTATIWANSHLRAKRIG